MISNILNQSTIVANGDASLFIVFEQQVNQSILYKVQAVLEIVATASANGELPGVIECVPAYNTLMINFDLRLTDFFILRDSLKSLLLKYDNTQDLVAGTTQLPVVDIPTCYDPSLAPDLESLAAFCQLSVDDVIHYHSTVYYSVYMLGFMPGFLYLGGLDMRLHMPRKSAPRMNIPRGSVGIAGQQTGIYPFSSPGGWQIIGRTPAILFDLEREPPVLAQPTQTVRFVPISLDEFHDLNQGAEK